MKRHEIWCGEGPWTQNSGFVKGRKAQDELHSSYFREGFGGRIAC